MGSDSDTLTGFGGSGSISVLSVSTIPSGKLSKVAVTEKSPSSE